MSAPAGCAICGKPPGPVAVAVDGSRKWWSTWYVSWVDATGQPTDDAPERRYRDTTDEVGYVSRNVVNKLVARPDGGLGEVCTSCWAELGAPTRQAGRVRGRPARPGLAPLNDADPAWQ